MMEVVRKESGDGEMQMDVTKREQRAERGEKTGMEEGDEVRAHDGVF